MRKVLIAAAVAVVLFATGAFAASFLVNSEDIASGTDNVVACATRVDVDFTTAPPTATTADWTVTGATLTFIDNTADPGDCNDQFATAVLQTTNGTTVNLHAAESNRGDINTGSTTVNFTPNTTPVAQVSGVAVLIDGIVIPTGP
jgi:hypothetical protein